MADKQVSITLTGRDNLSPVFQRVGQSATEAGRTIDQAGRSVSTFDRGTTTAAQSMGRYEQAVTKAESATSKLGISARTVGTAIGTAVSAGLLLSVRAAADAEVSQQRLQASIEATGALYDQFAGQISQTLNFALSMSFDDEDAADALSQLTQATGDTQVAIDRLGLAMDIARGRGIDLSAATKIVAAAEQERFGALRRLGIQIDENATKETVLADLQAKYAGQAEAYANTNAGAFERWGNAVENAAESVGGFLGPAQQVILILPGMAAGLSLVSAAAGTLAISLAAVAPALVAVGIAAGVAYVGYQALTQEGNVTTQSMENLAAGAENVAEALTMLAVAGDAVAVAIGTNAQAALAQAATDMQEMFRLTGEQATFQPGRANAEQQAAHDANMARLDELIAKYGTWDGAAGDVAAAEGDLLSILQGSGALHEQQLVALQQTNEAYASGSITFQQYIAGLDMVADMTGNVTTAMGPATTAVQEYLDALRDVSDSGDTFPSSGAGIVSTLGEVTTASEEAAQAQENGVVAMQAWLDIEQRIAGNSFAAGVSESAQAQEGLQRGIAAAADAMTYQVGESERLAAELEKQAEAVAKLQEQYAETFATMQSTATQATDTLDSVFRAIVENTNAIADQAQGVADWSAGMAVATEHVDEWGNSLGWWSVLDDLVYDATISQTDYNNAVAANTSIQESNASIQRDVLSIQAQLAPTIATATAALATQMDEIANGSTDAQLFALGMMDAATSSEALALAQGYLANQDVFGPMIQQAAELNPMLAQILEEMGLISYNPATGVVELLGAEEATSELDRLTEALDRLTMVQWMMMLDVDATQAEAAFEAATGQAVDWDGQEVEATATADTSQAEGAISDVMATINEWGGITATANANVNDNASGTLYSIISLLNSLDGRSVTNYINTVSTFSGSSISPLGYMTGGTIPAFENGGTVSPYGYSRAAANGMTATLVGERGPEVLMLPGGAQVMNTEGSRSRWKGNGGITVNLTINGSVGVDDITEQVSRKLVPAIQRAVTLHERSSG